MANSFTDWTFFLTARASVVLSVNGRHPTAFQADKTSKPPEVRIENLSQTDEIQNLSNPHLTSPHLSHNNTSSGGPQTPSRAGRSAKI
jgi:hypothetical protein